MTTRKVEIHVRATHNQINIASISPVLVELLEEHITIGQLIYQATEEKLREYEQDWLCQFNNERSQRLQQFFLFLNVLEMDIKVFSSRKPLEIEHSGPPYIDLHKEALRAQQAFANGEYTIWVDGKQYEKLNDEITLGPITRVVFLRLMPLKGG